jgi:hypothetical protein
MEPILAATKGANTCREAREPPGHVGLITFLSDISLRWKNNMDVILPYYPNISQSWHIISYYYKKLGMEDWRIFKHTNQVLSLAVSP